jgi:hypothetical protein
LESNRSSRTGRRGSCRRTSGRSSAACVVVTKTGLGAITDDKATLLAASDKFADLDEPWLAEAFKQAARNPIRVYQPEGDYSWRVEYPAHLGGVATGPNFLRVMVAMAKRLREIKEKLGW